jgi:DNA-binding CsgD family transcriptional regulator
MLARLRGTCPDLSKRELDVLRGVLEGSTTHDIGERFGVKPSSVVTYQKRAYRRLGISMHLTRTGSVSPGALSAQ